MLPFNNAIKSEREIKAIKQASCGVDNTRGGTVGKIAKFIKTNWLVKGERRGEKGRLLNNECSKVFNLSADSSNKCALICVQIENEICPLILKCRDRALPFLPLVPALCYYISLTEVSSLYKTVVLWRQSLHCHALQLRLKFPVKCCQLRFHIEIDGFWSWRSWLVTEVANWGLRPYAETGLTR